MKKTRPLILVTNDDSYHAQGIKNLVEVAKEFGEVVVVSPSKPQSGMGHAITINNILRLDEIQDFGDIRSYSCSGTPVDCVKLGIYAVLKRKPDLLLSGINHGENFSISVLYSGTMSAAVEGALEEIPSIGFSLVDHSHTADFSAAKRIVREIIKKSLEENIPKKTCLNVNIPAVPYDQIKGIKICRQGIGNWDDNFKESKDPSGRSYYWLAGEFLDMDHGKDSDIWAIQNNYVSIVPIEYDMTAHSAINELKKWKLDE